MTIDFETLTGRTDFHTINWGEEIRVHSSVKNDLIELQNQCLDHQIELRVASGFRSYERQVLIWEEKVHGIRPLYNKDEVPIDVKSASEQEILESLLAWSAIPGCSRHHWGTDFDLYDFSSFKNGGRLKLISSEYTDERGPCFHMNEYLSQCHDLKFKKPYVDSGTGIQAEPWHFSHLEISSQFEKIYDRNIFKKNLESAQFAFSKEILKNIDIYFNLYAP